MWRVYQLLLPAVTGREMKDNVLDEVFAVIDIASPNALLECVNILYDNKARFSSPMEFNTLFIDGLVKNDFFSFCAYMDSLNGSSKQRNHRD